MDLLHLCCLISTLGFANVLLFPWYIDQDFLFITLLALLLPFLISHFAVTALLQQIAPVVEPVVSTLSSTSSFSSSRSRAFLLWYRALRRVHRGLLSRRLWAHLGIYLQSPGQKALWSGLRRKGGSLYRSSRHGAVAPTLRSRRSAPAAAAGLR